MPYASIWLATDLDVGAELPWHHALRLAVAASAELTVVHANPRDSLHPWSRLPAASTVLAGWAIEGRVEPKFRGIAGRPAEVLPLVLHVDAPDLLVLGTHQRAGVERLMTGSVAEHLALNPGPGQALVVPEGCRGFVDASTGEISLSRILIPIDENTDQQGAVDAAINLARTAGGPVEFLLLHRGEPSNMPEVVLADGPDWWWRPVHVPTGAIVPMVLEHAESMRASAIVMLTHGHDSLIDAVRGSKTERVIREAHVPVLVVHA